MENTEKQNILFTSEKLQRELLSMKYIQEIFKELTDEVTKYLRVSTPKNIEQEENWIRDSKEKYEKGENINFIVTDTQGDFVGICWVEKLKTKTPELWLWLKQSARGKWYGKEMIKTIIKRVQEHSDFDYLIYRAHVDNIATRKIAESFGWVIQLDEKWKEKIFIEEKFDKSLTSEAVEYRIPKKLILPTWLSITNTISDAEYDHMIHTMEENDLSRYNIVKEDFTVIKNEKNEIISFGRLFEIWPKQWELGSLRVDEKYRGKKLWLLLSQELIADRRWDNTLYLATKNELGQYYEKLWFQIITKNIPEKLVHTGIWAKSQGIDYIIMKLK